MDIEFSQQKDLGYFKWIAMYFFLPTKSLSFFANPSFVDSSGKVHNAHQPSGALRNLFLYLGCQMYFLPAPPLRSMKNAFSKHQLIQTSDLIWAIDC